MNEGAEVTEKSTPRRHEDIGGHGVGSSPGLRVSVMCPAPCAPPAPCPAVSHVVRRDHIAWGRSQLPTPKLSIRGNGRLDWQLGATGV